MSPELFPVRRLLQIHASLRDAIRTGFKVSDWCRWSLLRDYPHAIIVFCTLESDSVDRTQK